MAAAAGGGGTALVQRLLSRQHSNNPVILCSTPMGPEPLQTCGGPRAKVGRSSGAANRANPNRVQRGHATGQFATLQIAIAAHPCAWHLLRAALRALLSLLQSDRCSIPYVARTSLSGLIRPRRCPASAASVCLSSPLLCSACTSQNRMWLRRAATGLLAGYQRHAAAGAAAGGALPPAPPAAVAALQQACRFSSRRSEGPGGVSIACGMLAVTTTVIAMPPVPPPALPSTLFSLCCPAVPSLSMPRCCLFISLQMHNTLL